MIAKRLSLVLFLFMIVVVSCKKNNTASHLNSGFAPSTEDSLISKGSFVDQRHPTSGLVKLYRNSSNYVLSFENFKSDNGPDLRTYLSSNLSDNDFIELGELKAVSGNFEYTFDLNTDIDKYKNVLIWCEDFSVLFGSATLTK